MGRRGARDNAAHAEHWRPWVESGQMVIFGTVLIAADDPVVTTGTGTI
jgi:hypothetical protein